MKTRPIGVFQIVNCTARSPSLTVSARTTIASCSWAVNTVHGRCFYLVHGARVVRSDTNSCRQITWSRVRTRWHDMYRQHALQQPARSAAPDSDVSVNLRNDLIIVLVYSFLLTFRTRLASQQIKHVQFTTHYTVMSNTWFTASARFTGTALLKALTQCKLGLMVLFHMQ